MVSVPAVLVFRSVGAQAVALAAGDVAAVSDSSVGAQPGRSKASRTVPTAAGKRYGDIGELHGQAGCDEGESSPQHQVGGERGSRSRRRSTGCSPAGGVAGEQVEQSLGSGVVEAEFMIAGGLGGGIGAAGEEGLL